MALCVIVWSSHSLERGLHVRNHGESLRMTFVLAHSDCSRVIRAPIPASETGGTHPLCAFAAPSSRRSSTATPCSTARATKTNSSKSRASSERTTCGSISTGSVCGGSFHKPDLRDRHELVEHRQVAWRFVTRLIHLHSYRSTTWIWTPSSRPRSERTRASRGRTSSLPVGQSSPPCHQNVLQSSKHSIP